MRNALVLSAAVCALAGSMAAAGLAGAASAAPAGARVPAGSVQGGVISTVAGGVGGPGRATSVALSPCGLRWSGGWLYIGTGTTVRRVRMATGVLTTVAGDNAAVPLDHSGTATASPISQACGTATDGPGNLDIPDGSQVLQIGASTGDIYAIAGTGSPRDGSPDGDGGPPSSAALSNAVDVAFDKAGNLLIADSGRLAAKSADKQLGSLVRGVAAAPGKFYGKNMSAGDIYTVAGVQSPAPAGDGGLATRAWLGPAIGSVRPDRVGNRILAEFGETGINGPIAPAVRVIAEKTGTFYGVKMTAGHIYRVAGNGQAGSGGGGDGGPATRASLDLAGSAVPDAAGNLVIGDNSRVRVVAARSGRFWGQQMTAGHIYGIAGTGLAGYSGDGGPAVKARVAAGTVTVDAAGNVLLAGGNRVTAAAGRVRAIAARTGTFYGQKMTAGHIYTVAGSGIQSSGDGGLPLRAEINDPIGVSVDGAGDIAVTATATGSLSVNTTVELIAARSGMFFGRALTAGRLYTVAGNGIRGFRGDNGPARDAEFCISAVPPNVQPAIGFVGGGAPLAFGGSTSLVVADGCNNRVRLIAVRSGRYFGQAMTAGDVYTIAGTGVSGFSGDGGPAVRARLSDPTGAGVDHHGNVLIADSKNRRVRVIAAATGTFYGQKMTVGRIYTIAPGLSFPDSVAVDHDGNVLIGDPGKEAVLVFAAATGTFYGQKMLAGHIYTIAGPGGFSGVSVAGVTTDRLGNVIISDPGLDGGVLVLAEATGTFCGQALTAGDTDQFEFSGDTLGDGSPFFEAEVGGGAVAVSPAGSLLIADGADNRLRAISP